MAVFVGAGRVLLVAFTDFDEETCDPIVIDGVDVVIVAVGDAFAVVCIAGGVDFAAVARIVNGVDFVVVVRIDNRVAFDMMACLLAASSIYIPILLRGSPKEFANMVLTVAVRAEPLTSLVTTITHAVDNLTMELEINLHIPSVGVYEAVL